jgi:Glycosyl hydrolases family 43
MGLRRCLAVPALAIAFLGAGAVRVEAAVTQTAFERHETVVAAGAFKRIYDPSAGEDRPWYVNDHAFIRDARSGRWHLYGITHAEPGDPLHETLFAHATADSLTQSQWVKQPPALQADGSDLEHYIWAPYVLHHDGRYWMFYAGGNEQHFNSYAIQLATSTDLVHWTRNPGNPLFRDGYEARDPMVLRVHGRWVMYYTATSDPNGGHHVVAYRTSRDLRHWGPRHIALTDPNSGTAGGPTESPFVVHHGGAYYLFTCCGSGRDYGAEYMKTNVYRSRDPLHFDVAKRAGTIPAHAAEVVRGEHGRWYISSAGWGKGGVQLAPLDWRSDQVTAGRTITTPYYRAVVQTAPETVITSLGVDPSGQGNYRPALDSSWRPTGPYLAVGGFGDTDRPGAAAGVQPSPDGRSLALTGIPLGDEPATVDWTLDFGERSFDQSFRWHVTAPLSASAWEVAWSWDTALAHVGDASGTDRPAGDVHGFGDWTMAYGDDTTLVAAYKRGSAWSEDNRYFDPPDGGVSWQPLWQIGGRSLAPGDYAGGTWRIGASGSSADAGFADRLAAELNG